LVTVQKQTAVQTDRKISEFKLQKPELSDPPQCSLFFILLPPAPKIFMCFSHIIAPSLHSSSRYIQGYFSHSIRNIGLEFKTGYFMAASGELSSQRLHLVMIDGLLQSSLSENILHELQCSSVSPSIPKPIAVWHIPQNLTKYTCLMWLKRRGKEPMITVS
jgi:hypothetical protein